MQKIKQLEKDSYEEAESVTSGTAGDLEKQ